MAKKMSKIPHLQLPDSPIRKIHDSEKDEELMKTLEQIVLPDPCRIPAGKGEEVTMEEAKKRFYVAADNVRDIRNLIAPRLQLSSDSGVGSSIENTLTSSSGSHDGDQVVNAPNNLAVAGERQPLLPNHDLTRMWRVRQRVRQFTQSWYFTFVLLLLLICPAAYLYIGGAFFEQCKNLQYLQISFTLMGVSSFVAVIARVFRHIAEKLHRLEGSRKLCTYVAFFTISMFLLAYFIDLCFYINIDHKEHEDCNLFLTWTSYSLWITPLVLLVLFILYEWLGFGRTDLIA